MNKSPELYQDVADALYRLGWRPNCDAQHENLRDALPQLRSMLSPPIVDGGPAFPQVETRYEGARGDYTQYVESSGGATLRDYFAAKALSGIMANPERWKQIAKDYESGKKTYEQCSMANAVKAYSIADAMLKARQS